MKSYLITDPSFYGSEISTFVDNLTSVVKKFSPDYILLRDKETKNYRDLAYHFKKVCDSNSSLKCYLHQDINLASELKVFGVHLSSNQLNEIPDALSKGLNVIVSTHTHEEASYAANLGVHAITYSPIFFSPGKGTPKGLEDLKEIVDTIKVPIFALGGIVHQDQIDAVKSMGVYGFASIRYFIQ